MRTRYCDALREGRGGLKCEARRTQSAHTHYNWKPRASVTRVNEEKGGGKMKWHILDSPWFRLVRHARCQTCKRQDRFKVNHIWGSNVTWKNVLAVSQSLALKHGVKVEDIGPFTQETSLRFNSDILTKLLLSIHQRTCGFLLQQKYERRFFLKNIFILIKTFPI